MLSSAEFAQIVVRVDQICHVYSTKTSGKVTDKTTGQGRCYIFDMSIHFIANYFQIIDRTIICIQTFVYRSLQQYLFLYSFHGVSCYVLLSYSTDYCLSRSKT